MHPLKKTHTATNRQKPKLRVMDVTVTVPPANGSSKTSVFTLSNVLSGFLGLLAVLYVSLHVASVVIGAKYADDACIGGGSAASVPWNLPFGEYLWIYGAGFLGSGYLIAALTGISSYCRNGICTVLGLVLTLLLVVCKIVWIVYGALLYFWYVQPNCDSDGTIYVFGMLWFCFNSVAALVLAAIAIALPWYISAVVNQSD